ncbi:MAG: hypothetical protein GF355_02335 [Candidatus Eisenbacteria bacterium]|nr:hypothetical protein [Candidatus Eisenbacteria bacterium]
MITDKKFGPLRIEMATSDIEGGVGAAWGDPDRVMGVVANSEPAGAFTKYLLPNLLAATPAAPEAAPTLPEAARCMLAAFEVTHRRLYKANRSALKDPNWIQVLGAVVDGSQLHVLSCGTGWAYVIRDSQAHLLELEDVDADETSPEMPSDVPPALGRQGSMRLRVVTLDLLPNDQVLLLGGAAPPAPDLRAVANAFHRTQDLKRGCDGLVNLLGLNGSSGAAVAFRLVPVASESAAGDHQQAGKEVLGELVAEVESLNLAMSRREEGQPEHESPQPEHEPPQPETVAAGKPAPSGKSVSSHRAGSSATRTSSSRPPTEAAGASPWRPSYSQQRSRWVPVVVWSILLILISLAGIVTLYKPGWQEVRQTLQELFSREESPAASTGAEAEVAAALDRGSGAASGAVPGVGDESTAPGDGMSAGGRNGSAGGEAGSSPIPPGMGVVAVAPRPGAGSGKAWTEEMADHQPVPGTLLLAAGWQRIFYEDEEVVLWSQRVQVREGETTRVQVQAPRSDEKAYLQIESYHLNAGRGFVPADGDSIFLDGRFLGRTPWEGDVDPGWHSVRVASADGLELTEVFSLAPGQSRYCVPRMGLQELPDLDHRPPGRVLLQGSPVLLSVKITVPEGESVREPLLNLVRGPDDASKLNLAPVNLEQGLYVAAVEPDHFIPDQPVRYYFSCRTTGGTPVASEIYTLVPVSDLSQLAD